MQSYSSGAPASAHRTSTKATSPSTSQESTSRRSHDSGYRTRPALGGPRGSLKWTPDRSPLQSLSRELAALEKHVGTGERLAPAVARPLSTQEQERLHRSSTLRARLESEDGYARVTTKRSRGALISSIPAFGQPAASTSNSQNSSNSHKQRQSVRRNERAGEIPTDQPVRRLSSRRRQRITMRLDGNDDMETEIRNRRYNEEGTPLGRLTLKDKDLSGEHRSDSIIHAHPDEARLQDLGRTFFISQGPTTPTINLEPESIEYGTLKARNAMDRAPSSRLTLDVDKLDTLSSDDSYMIGRAILKGRAPSTLHRMSVYDAKLATHQPEVEDQELIWLTAIKPRAIPDPHLFKPEIAIRCGPLLRYKGLRRESATPGIMGQRGNSEMEVWRGSVLIVTVDEESSYDRPPTLRLFSQPISALQDPRMPLDTPRVFKMKDGESRNKFCTVKGLKLHVDRGHTFWRFDLEVELCDKEARIAYKVNHGPAFAFYVPAREQSFNIMFHSCNGFSLNIDPDTFKGTNPMWRDALNNHTKRPFHVMLGGGDQIYNDAVTKQTTLFKEWLNILNPITKHKAPFTPEIADELESFYLNRYCDWFSQGLFGVAIAQIPMVNIWDDHDIIDGFGSYPSHFNRCPVFSGLGNVAFKYYMLFQHQSLVEEEERHEPSWVLGHAPGPYIHEKSRNIFMFLGRKIAFLGLDCRTERMRGQVVSAETYGIVFDRLRQEIIPGETKHLLVMLGVPIAYPRLVWLENLLTSRIMDPIKFLARIGVIDGFLNTFDGGVEILDDLDDHWTAKNHKKERNEFIEELQELAMEKSVRITILGGDVHLAGIGRFYSNPERNVHTINDFRYMPNVISSAIVNAPPPNTMADVLNKRNKIHHLNADTDEDMVPIFPVDVDEKPRNNKRMMPRRNYCTINAYSGEIKNTTEVPPQPKERSPKGIMKLFKKEPGSDGSLTGVRRAQTDMFFTDQADIPLEDALEVNLRVEINQKDEEGKTRPYQFLVPRLDVEDGIADCDVPQRPYEMTGHWI